MITDKVKALLCKNEILEQLMAIPIGEIISYCKQCDSVNPEDALRYLAEMYIDNCGVSTGLRSFADYCSVFWIERLKKDLENDFTTRYGDAQTLPELLPFFSDNYTEEIDKYDICFMTDVALRDILLEELQDAPDDKTKIILCAGICDFLPNASNDRWMDFYPMAKIEEALVYLRDKSLMQHRSYKASRQHTFTEEEVRHFKLLNERLVELQREVMDHVRTITLNLQQQIANGLHQYDNFNVEGIIYIEDMEDDVDSLLNILARHAKYTVRITNDKSTPETIDELNKMDINWYGNWRGIFHRLESEHGLKVCRPFCKMFEEARVFTIADIMKIKPEMMFSHIEINI